MPTKTSIESKYTVDASTGCWLWNKPLTTGYGLVRVDGGQKMAHRVIYELHKGAIPPGLHLHHLCKHPSCVNPSHLEPLTRKRHSHKSRTSKLTPEKAAIIRQAYIDGQTLSEISQECGISISHLSTVVRGHYWPGVLPLDQRAYRGCKRPKPGKRKLNDSQVKEIIFRRQSGETRTAVAKRFGISTSTVSKVTTGRNWCSKFFNKGETNG